MPNRYLQHTVALFVLITLVIALPACQQLPPIKLRLVNVADPAMVERFSDLDYPAEAPTAQDLDIVVRQWGGAITLTNREAREFGPMLLWLNRQYVTEVERIHVGHHPDNRIALDRFVNRFGEPFPQGTFLAPEKEEHVLVAELMPIEAEIDRHRLVVRRGDFLRTFAGER